MRRTLLFLLLPIFWNPVHAFSSDAPPSQAYLKSLYDSLTHPVLDGQKISEIADLSLVRGGQKITFISGMIRFFAPVRGKKFGCVFTGSGKYTIAPPTEIERLEFERRTGNKLLDGTYTYPFERAVLWFADSVFDELQPHCKFQGNGVQRPEREAVDRGIKFVTDHSNENSPYRILQETFEAHPQPYLLAHLILDREGNDLFLDYDMRRFEEVIISQPFVGYSGGFNFWRDPMCS